MVAFGEPMVPYQTSIDDHVTGHLGKAGIGSGGFL